MTLLLHMTLIIDYGCNMNLWIILRLGWVDIKLLVFITVMKFFVHVTMAKMKVGKSFLISIRLYHDDFRVTFPSGLWQYHSWLTTLVTLEINIIHLHGFHQLRISSGTLLTFLLRPLMFQVHDTLMQWYL